MNRLYRNNSAKFRPSMLLSTLKFYSPIRITKNYCYLVTQFAALATLLNIALYNQNQASSQSLTSKTYQLP